MPPSPLDVYTIVEVPDQKARWVKVGIAFVNRDGSMNLKLDVLPVNGTLHVRERKARPAENVDDDE